jgi:hypothetical protein
MSLLTKLRRVGAIMAALAGLGFSTPSSAIPIELALVVDASGSISSSEWQIQMQGYNNAILDVLPTDGTVAVSVIRFAQTASVVRSMTLIDSVTARNDLASFFTTLSQAGNGTTTCISCGIIAAEGTFSGSATRSIIDVSTDGVWNTGVNPAGPAATIGTSRWAVDVGRADVVNAIGIGTSTAPNFAYGEGSFSLLAASFQAFEPVLIEKLRRETGQLPEPGTLALLAVTLVGIGYARRRSA